MEVTNEATKKTAKGKSETQQQSEGFDWAGLAINSGLWLMQGLMMGIGGAAAAHVYNSASSAGAPSNAAGDSNVVPMRKSSNA